MTDNINYVGFWGRLGATVIDSILFLIITGIPLTMIYGPHYYGNFDGMNECISANQQCEQLMMRCTANETGCDGAILSCSNAKQSCTAFVEEYQERPFIHGVWDVVLKFIFPFVIAIWMWKQYMGTPAKCLFKMRIVDAKTFQAVSTQQAIIRYFAYIVSMVPLFLGFFWIGFDKRKQGFHDKLSNTVVIYDNSYKE